MRGRLVRLAVAAALVGGAFAVQGASVAGADDHDPIGYTIGIAAPGVGVGTLRCNFYKIDLKTGAATQVNAVNGSLECGDGLSFDDDGTLYAYRNVAGPGGGVAQLVTIDKHTGVQTLVGQLPRVIVGNGGMTFDADGHLWLYAFASGDPASRAVVVLPVRGEQEDGRGPVRRRRADRDRRVRARCGLRGRAGDHAVRAHGGERRPAGTGERVERARHAQRRLHKIADTPGIVFPTGLDFDSEDDLWALASTNLSGPGVGMQVDRVDPRNGNTGPTDVTENGVPFIRTMNGLAVSPIGDCESETTTTAPPTPVVAAEPVFTG